MKQGQPRICTHTGRLANFEMKSAVLYTPSKDGNSFNYIGKKMFYRTRKEAQAILDEYINSLVHESRTADLIEQAPDENE